MDWWFHQNCWISNQVHKKGIIHKDINSSNIIYNLENQILKIIDFGISTDLSNEKIQNLSLVEGTLAYISPEQTGKMNRAIDYRSDYYSMGVTYYEIFTGQLPFDGDDLEVIHGHIAKVPVEPTKINSNIPKVLSKL